MIKAFFILFLSSLFSLQAFSNVKVRIRIATYPTKINVQGMGVVFEADKTPYKKVSLPRLESFKVTYKNKSWNIESGELLKTIDAPYLALEGSFLKLNASEVPSKVFLWPKENSVDVIAVLEIDEYLRGVIPSEMPATWPIEALKAQAVVARSFTLKQVQSRRAEPYHLDSTVNDQVYKYDIPISYENLKKINDIIASTKGMVLVDDKLQVVRALYHADCAGRTEKSSNVWGGNEVEFSVVDPHCPQASAHTWELSILKNDIAKVFQIKDPVVNVEKVNLTDSGRVKKILIKTAQNKYYYSGQVFRKKMGYSKIKSTHFEISEKDGKLLFKGLGFGHGVGMCQWGARKWADNGKDYKAILKHYFPGYKLHTL